MERKAINIKGLSVKNYKRDENAYDLHVFLEINGQKKILAKRYEYGKAENIVSNLIQVIKNEFKKDNISWDDPLEQTIVVMENLEDVEEKIIMFVKRVHDKIRDFKSHKIHTNYINLYNSIDGLRTEF